MRKTKVLNIVATGRLSGAEKVIADICTNLSPEFEAYAICAGEELKNYYEEKGIKTFIADISKLNPSEIGKIKKIIKDENIDIVHAHDVKPSIAGYLAARSLKVPVISHIHVNYLWMKDNKIMTLIDRYFRNKYRLSIACSELVRDYYLENNSKVQPQSVLYLDNAFNFSEFEKVNIVDKDKFKDQLNVNKDKYIFGFLGRLIAVKGADLLIKSFANIASKNDDAMLMIVGDGEERSKLEELVKQLNIEDKVYFAGYQKNVYDYMNIFDCFILPSIREGLPIAVLEAMAMKKPVISTPVAGLAKLIKNKQNGIMLTKRTEDELTESMTMLYENRQLGVEIGENAHNYLIENYNIKAYINRLEEIYKSI